MKSPFSDYATKDKNLIISELNSSLDKGLPSEEVIKRQKQSGLNEIKRKEIGIRTIFVNQIKSPFLLLLLAASLISFFIEGPINASIIFFIILINACLGFYQEYSAHRVEKLLRRLMISYIRVLRNGKEMVIPSTKLVVGDIIFVEPGSIIPADVRLIETYNVSIDESTLTGESVPVKKDEKPLKAPIEEAFKASNIGFAGTHVVTGKATGIVYAIGNQTHLASITQLARETVQEGILKKDITRFSRFMIYIIFITLICVIATNIIIKQGNVNLIHLFLFALALAVGITPEALPIVITFALSRGARKLAKHKVIVKRLSAIEDLGSIEVLCTDKTGTLTENIMSVDAVYSSDPVHTKLLATITGSLPETYRESTLSNSFDRALFQSLSKTELAVLKNYKKKFTIPYDEKLRMNAAVIEHEHKTYLVARGSAIDVIKLCATIPQKESLISWVTARGAEGKRVLTIALKEIQQEQTPYRFDNFHFIGSISFHDPLKKTTLPAIQKAKQLGIIIKVITGDAPEVAEAVAKQLNLIKPDQSVITGEFFDSLSESEKNRIVETHTIFSRISPKNKFTIVQILQKKYKVGFLGDGINDMPALKIAHVGLSVSGATDIAREAADIIFIKKSLLIMINTIEEGRKVFANMLTYLNTTLASNFGNFYSIAIASLMIDFLPMLPRQILLLNLLSDFPMLTITSDTVDIQKIQKPTTLNLRNIAFFATILGLTSSVFDFIFFGLFYRQPEGTLQTNWFIVSILTEVALIFSVRTKRLFFKAPAPSAPLIALSVLSVILTLLIPFNSLGQHLLYFVKPSVSELSILIMIVIGYFIATEGIKLAYYSYVNHENQKS